MLLFPANIQDKLIDVHFVRNVRLLLIRELEKACDHSLQVLYIQQDVMFYTRCILLENDTRILVLVLELSFNVGDLFRELTSLLVTCLILDPELDLLKFDLACQLRRWSEYQLDYKEVLARYSEGLGVDGTLKHLKLALG